MLPRVRHPFLDPILDALGDLVVIHVLDDSIHPLLKIGLALVGITEGTKLFRKLSIQRLVFLLPPAYS